MSGESIKMFPFRIYDARMDIDHHCNFKCFYCWTPHNRSTVQKRMSLDVLKKVLTYCNKYCWHIYLSCGGEPLLHPEFAQIMKLVKERVHSADVTIITNGWLLNGENAQSIIDAQITSVAVSIDTLNPQRYAEVVGLPNENALERVKKNVEELIRLRGEKKYPKIIINAILMKSTVMDLRELGEWICKTGIDGLRLLPFQPQSEIMREKEYISPNNAEAIEIVSNLKTSLSKKRKFFDYPFIGSFQKVFSVFSGLSINRNKLEFLLYAIRKFVLVVLKKQCNTKELSIFCDFDGFFSVCPDRVQPLGDIDTIVDKSLRKLVKNKSKTWDNKVCLSCNRYTSNKPTKETNTTN